MAASRALTSADCSKFNDVSKAKSLKKYLCVPDGGFGPLYLFSRLVFPCVAPGGTEFSAMDVVDGLIFHKVQCVQVPDGASGSSIIKTKLCAFAGISENSKGGF